MQSSATSTTSTSIRHRLRFTWRRFLFTLCFFAIVAYAGIAIIASSVLTIPVRRPLSGTPATVNLRYDDVQFPARGGDVAIDSWYVPADAQTDRKQAIIFVHGKDGCRTCEFQGGALRFVAAMQQRGFSFLMIDLRGHGESEDARFTFGIDERRDIEGAVDWLLARGFKPGAIGLLGVSMGAASSIGAAADEPAIGALVSDSAYAEIYSIMEREFPKQSGLPGFFLPGVSFMTRFVAGQDLGSARPVDEISRIAPRPVFVIHASGDKLIPAQHAEQLAQASSGAQLWIVNGSGHARTYAVEPQQYVERVATFFAASLR